MFEEPSKSANCLLTFSGCFATIKVGPSSAVGLASHAGEIYFSFVSEKLLKVTSCIHLLANTVVRKSLASSPSTQNSMTRSVCNKPYEFRFCPLSDHRFSLRFLNFQQKQI